MYRFLFIPIIMTMIMMPNISNATEVVWDGAQTQTSIHGDIDLLENKLQLHGTGSFFWVPETNSAAFFAYLGPKWLATDWLHLMPAIGYTGRMTDNGEDAFIASLWTLFLIEEGMFTLFLETEGYFSNEQSIYYGFYSFDFNFSEWGNVGLHAEQVNLDVMFGPHIGFGKGPWRLEIQYYAGPDGDIYYHAMRVCNSLSF